jgi:hypothetical protein
MAAKPVAKTPFPRYCDFSCEHAAFSDPAASGACRRDIAVWCAARQGYNNKHARCFFEPDGTARVRAKKGSGAELPHS